MVKREVWVVEGVPLSENSRMCIAKLGGDGGVDNFRLGFTKTPEASGGIIDNAETSFTKTKTEVHVSQCTERWIKATKFPVNGLFDHKTATRDSRIFASQSTVVIISISGRLAIEDIADGMMNADDETSVFDAPVMLENLTGNTTDIATLEGADELSDSVL